MLKLYYCMLLSCDFGVSFLKKVFLQGFFESVIGTHFNIIMDTVPSLGNFYTCLLIVLE